MRAAVHHTVSSKQGFRKPSWQGLIAALCLLALPSLAQAVTVTEYAVPTADSTPWGITVGKDGYVWFTEIDANKIGKISVTGDITEYVVPTADSRPYGIVVGPNQTIWFTESGADRIGRISAAGAFTEYYLGADSAPMAIAPYSSNASRLWFAARDRIGLMYASGTRVGTFTEYAAATPPVLRLQAMAIAGSTAWVAENVGSTIRRFRTDGTVVQHTIPTADPGVFAITRGKDGALWFTEAAANKIGRMTTSGVFTEYPIPTPDSHPAGITVGPDGHVWFTELNAGQIGRITSGGVITEFPVGEGPVGITEGPDGNLWVTESSANKIARVNDPSFLAACADVPDPTCLAGAAGSLQLKMGSNARLKWKWSKSLAVSPEDFGDPIASGTGYKLCLYTETAGMPAFEMRRRVFGGPSCEEASGVPCWRQIPAKGWSYRGDKGDVYKLSLKGGGFGKSSINVDATLDSFTPSSEVQMFDPSSTVIVQLLRTDDARCWTNSFDVAGGRKNDGRQFKASKR